jgi:hypothetical protein
MPKAILVAAVTSAAVGIAPPVAMEQGLCARTAGENPREQAVNTAIIPLRCLKLLDEREKGAITSKESPDSRRRIKLFKLIDPSCHYIPIFWKKTMGKIRPEDSHSARDAADGLEVPDRVIMVSAERGPAQLGVAKSHIKAAMNIP